MITITKQSTSVLFEFDENQHYLYNGSIEIPYNTLSIISDQSDMITLKKAYSNDIFLSARFEDFGYASKEAALEGLQDDLFAETGGGSGSGVTSGEVESMISEALEDYPTNDDLEDALEDYYTQTEVDAGFSSVTSSVTAVNASLTAHTADTGIHTTTAEKAVWNAKQTALTAGTGIDITNNVISVTGGTGGSNVVELTQAQYEALVDKDPDVLYVITDAPEISISGKADTSAVTAVNDVVTAHTANTSIHVSQNEKNTWNAKQNALTAGTGIDITNDVISVTGGTGGGISSAQCQTMIEDYCDPKEEVIATALNDLNDRVEDLESGGSSVTIATAITSSSTNDEAAGALATYNAITAATTGGGATYSAGTNISIDTANTINCTLPITANTTTFIAGSPSVVRDNNILIGSTNMFRTNYEKNVIIGNNAKASQDCVVIGRSATGGTNTNYDWNNIAIGSVANANGGNHVAIGYAVSATGTTKMNLNDQIKVDTNNQVYIKDKTNTTDVCIQDAIAALGGLKFVKCTQAEYDALVQGGTVDSNTLYIINNVV